MASGHIGQSLHRFFAARSPPDLHIGAGVGIQQRCWERTQATVEPMGDLAQRRPGQQTVSAAQRGVGAGEEGDGGPEAADADGLQTAPAQVAPGEAGARLIPPPPIHAAGQSSHIDSPNCWESDNHGRNLTQMKH